MPQDSEAYKKNPSLAVLLIGPPLVGKTNTAFQFPDPYILDADDKMLNAVTRFPDKKFKWDCPLRKPDGTPIPDIDQWQYVQDACINPALKDPWIKTIIIDSASAVNEMIKRHIMKHPTPGSKGPLMVGGEKVMEMSQWQPFGDIWRRLIMGCRASGKILIVTAHERVEKDEMSGQLMYRPLVPGAFGDGMGGLFTDVWHCEAEVGPDLKNPGKTKTNYKVRTQPTARIVLGSGLQMPALLDQDEVWPEASKRLNLVPEVKAEPATKA